MAVPRKPRKLDAAALWDYALKTLAMRAHSSGEIRSKLSRRAATPSDVSLTIAKLREYALLDDARFSEAFAASRLQNQGFGRARVLRDLRSRRVAGTTAESAVSQVFAGADENQLIERFLARKYRGKNLAEFLSEEKNLAAAYRRLRLAGFSTAASVAALRRRAQRADEFEPPPDDD